MAKQTQRPKFYEQQYLGADDLTAAVNYGRYQDARHALGAHTWGIAVGLQLTEKPSPGGGSTVDVFIQPGYAWDGFGRPVVVLSPYKIPSARFASIPYDAGLDTGPPEGRLVKVWLRYVESGSRGPGPGFETCEDGEQLSRFDEFFVIEAGDFPISEQRTPISLAGRSVDAAAALQTFNPADPLVYDASIPHQTFPEDGQNVRWLIPLGVVRWKPAQNPGETGSFIKREPPDLEKSAAARYSCGVVAGAVHPVDGSVRMRSRTGSDPSTTTRSNDLVWVEGTLRVDDDLRLFGSDLVFLKPDGTDDGVPLTAHRLEADAGGGKQLQVRIGVAEAGSHKFTVGPVIGTDFKPRLAVLDRGEVGIGTITPNRLLTIQGAADSFMNLRTTAGAQELLLGADASGGIVSTMTNHDLLLRAGGNSTKVTIKADGDVGVGEGNPLNTLHVARGSHLNVIFDRTDTTDHLTAVVGSVGSGLRFSDSNFFFIGTEPYADRNSNGTGAAELLRITTAGDVGIGTSNPLGKLDVRGRILRHGQPLCSAGQTNHGGIISVPWGTTSDWVIFVAPRVMGQQEPDSEFDNALLMVECFATPTTATDWLITARYKFRFSNGSDTGDGTWFGGFANFLLVPR